MIRTKVDALWFKCCSAYHLQLFPASQTVSKLVALQDMIERECDGPLLRVPAQGLHMTVVTLLNAASQLSTSNDEVWSLKGKGWQETIERSLSATFPFDICFREVAASEAAIFLMAQEPPELRRLRSTISAAVSFEDWRPKPPRIGHITLFRFSAEEWLSMPNIDAGLLPIEFKVETLQLVKERRYPSVEVDMLGELPFRGASMS
ncbi:hypothetical protein GCM10010520_54780 [Rhizobium viscosum]|uniref:2'-5' RNA ligase n=1 Tax=Rhizobium viscosum TaxID=1673 RepID=A0ABR9IZS7_RHIVS|nr:2'-5' RNA ligase family protein [Rhizobium viscosum]MBE1508723.1 hypothetical protein [Rhizobium viscosum]